MLDVSPTLHFWDKLRGRIKTTVPLSPLIWFRAGGTADYLYKPADRDDLVDFIRHKPVDLPFFPLGVGSNILVREGGIKGVVLRLVGPFAEIRIDPDPYLLTVGAGALDQTVALQAAQAGIGGLEFLVGIPGTIGGALRMNAGAYGREMKDIVVSTDVLFKNGTIKTLKVDELDFSYRHCSLPADVLFLSAVLRGMRIDPQTIHKRHAEIRAEREASQPYKSRTGGSTFKNPAGHKAWKLIDQAGCRGLARGGAKVSEQHCNFLINTGNATASDLEALGEEVRERVQNQTGILLEWEIIRIGREEKP